MPPRVKIQRARALRADQTHFEARLWAELRAYRMAGWKWRRQAPVGPYVVDFLCVQAGLAVELDGDQHAPSANTISGGRIGLSGKA